MTFDCKFCNRKCRKVSPEKGDHDRAPYWRCDYHGSVVVKHYWINDVMLQPMLSYVALIAYYKEDRYAACLMYNYDHYPYKFRLDKVNPYPKTTQSIITLDFHPDITPENVTQKLPTLILFS